MLNDVGRWEDAVTTYRAAIDLKHHRGVSTQDTKKEALARLHHNLAAVLLRHGRSEAERSEAVQALRESVRLDPRNAQFSLDLGKVLRRMGDDKGARAALEDAKAHASDGSKIADEVNRELEALASPTGG